MKRNQRYGGVLICVLVCLAIASSLTASVVRQSLQSRRQTRRHEQVEQTRWLLEAGIVKIRQMAESDAWEDQAWDVSDAFPAFHQASVEMKLIEESSGRFEIVAILQRDDAAQSITRRSAVITLPKLVSSRENQS